MFRLKSTLELVTIRILRSTSGQPLLTHGDFIRRIRRLLGGQLMHLWLILYLLKITSPFLVACVFAVEIAHVSAVKSRPWLE